MKEIDNLTLDGEEVELTQYAKKETVEKIQEEVTNQNNRFIALEQNAGDTIIPAYVIAEAQVVAEKVAANRNAYSFVFGGISDLHTDGTIGGQINTTNGIIHAGMAMDQIQSIAPLDLIVNFGDIMIGKLNDTYKSGFAFVNKCFHEAKKRTPYIQMPGNHDELSSDTTEEARQKYFAYIGANNKDTVTDFDNRFRNYGYRDFEGHRMRVIYLNSVDVSEVEQTGDCYITAAQYSWFVNVALDFSDKPNPETWHFIVMCHHPLNWYSTSMPNLLTILDAYKGKSSGSITVDSSSITYDFTNAKATFIAHFHGHLHNFRTEIVGTNGVISITIPNACYGRNNEYGTSTSYDDTVHDMFGDVDADGNQRSYIKVSDTAEDTAFNVVVVDTQNEVIHAFCYGAGIDRTITFDGIVTETEKDTGTQTPNDSTDSTGYTNVIDTVGYTDDYRLSTSTGEIKEAVGYVTTGLINLSKYDTPLTIRTNGVDFRASTNENCAYAWYSADEEFFSSSYLNELSNSSLDVSFDDEGNTTFVVTSLAESNPLIRFTGYGSGADLIVTVNEEITDVS